MKNRIPNFIKSTGAVALGLLSLSSACAQVFTNVDAYTLPTWHSPYVVEPILSVGDTVPRASNPAQQFQMIGIPDGLGMYQINQFNARQCSGAPPSDPLSDYGY